MFDFTLHAEDGAARTGTFTTPHGEVETPVFMPVGTSGSVKGVSPEEVKATGASMILANTYHLYLRPGHEVVGELGGVHDFMRWDGPILRQSEHLNDYNKYLEVFEGMGLLYPCSCSRASRSAGAPRRACAGSM